MPLKFGAEDHKAGTEPGSLLTDVISGKVQYESSGSSIGTASAGSASRATSRGDRLERPDPSSRVAGIRAHAASINGREVRNRGFALQEGRGEAPK